MKDGKDFKNSDWYIEARRKLAQMGISDTVANGLFPKDCDEDTAEMIMEFVMRNPEKVKKI